MKATYVPALLGLALLASPAHAQSGPAFDCSKAEHEIEDLICKDEELAAKDRKLAEVYKEAIKVMEGVDAGGPEAIQELKTYQRGWIGGRNECWKAEDKRQCTADIYDRRIAQMQAKYFLIDGGDPVYYNCSDNSQIVVTFIPSEPPSIRMERGDSTEVGILSPAGSGSRYDADFGVFFWLQGDEAQVAWPQDTEFNCVVQK
jgi:uncharacterized protein